MPILNLTPEEAQLLMNAIVERQDNIKDDIDETLEGREYMEEFEDLTQLWVKIGNLR